MKNKKYKVKNNGKSKLTGLQKTLIVGAVSLAVGGTVAYHSIPRQDQPIREQIINPSFQEAQKNEGLRQRYIEQRTALLSKEFDRTFNTRIIEAVFYDPDYRQLDEACKVGLEKYQDNPIKADYFRESLRKNQENRASENKKHLGVTILPTANFAEGEPSEIYFSVECFDPKLVASEDEFLSILDHELFHAACANKGIPIKHEVALKYGLGLADATQLSRNLSDAIMEVAAYHQQLRLIEEGVRIVRPKFRQRLVNSYNDFYQPVKLCSDRSDDSFDSRFCTALIESLTYFPGPRKR